MMSKEKEALNKIERSFSERPQDDQEALLKYTWCNTCMEVDLGMKSAREFELEERVWIEGECLKCGEVVITELEEE